jgi:hypothetical protein
MFFRNDQQDARCQGLGITVLNSDIKAFNSALNIISYRHTCSVENSIQFKMIYIANFLRKYFISSLYDSDYEEYFL